MKVLITGSAGFVGRHMIRALAEHDLTLIDLAAGDDCIDFFRGNQQRYDLAIHCAATVGGRASIDGSPLSIATNLALDSLYFRWLERTRTDRAVYFSSSAAYPVYLQARGMTIRLPEDAINPLEPAKPDATYGLAKVTGERLALEAEANGVNVLVVRPFSGYGEDQSLDYPFPSFIDRARRRCDPFDIWGDGTQIRDWIHIDDIVGATLAALDQGVQAPLNLCTGIATTFNDLAAKVCTAAGYSPDIRHLTAAPSGVHHRVGDPTAMLEVYAPKISIEDGIARALAPAFA